MYKIHIYAHNINYIGGWEPEKLAKPDPATLTMRTSSTVGQRELEKRGKKEVKMVKS